MHCRRKIVQLPSASRTRKIFVHSRNFAPHVTEEWDGKERWRGREEKGAGLNFGEGKNDGKETGKDCKKGMRKRKKKAKER